MVELCDSAFVEVLEGLNSILVVYTTHIVDSHRTYIDEVWDILMEVFLFLPVRHM